MDKYEHLVSDQGRRDFVSNTLMVRTEERNKRYEKKAIELLDEANALQTQINVIADSVEPNDNGIFYFQGPDRDDLTILEEEEKKDDNDGPTGRGSGYSESNYLPPDVVGSGRSYTEFHVSPDWYKPAMVFRGRVTGGSDLHDKLPHEIYQMILGNLSNSDLHNLLQTRNLDESVKEAILQRLKRSPKNRKRPLPNNKPPDRRPPRPPPTPGGAARRLVF